MNDHNPENFDDFKFIIKRGPIDGRQRQLIISSDFIEFENKDLINDSFSRFTKDEITGYKFGIKWIRGFELPVGREYRIFIKSKTNEEIKISFKSFYGIKKNEYHKLYVSILDAIWKMYFHQHASDLLDKFHNDEDISIGNVSINKEAVTIRVNRVLNSKEVSIPWEQLDTRSYQTYFAIFSKEDPAKINATFKYLEDWNIEIMYSVMRSLQSAYSPSVE